jgi:hypothetical protein
MPWLARKIPQITASDPEFAVDVYRSVFSHGVSDTSTTSIGGSRILPLRSNRRQDYEMSKFTLKEAFPRFLEYHPVEAVRAIIGALEGYVASEHPIPNETQEIVVRVGSLAGRLTNDGSYIWAWDPDDAHSDNAQSLVRALVARLKEAPDRDASLIANEVIRGNRLAIFWSRMFLAAVKRGEPLSSLLWPFAIQMPFLQSLDTIKDAIDLVVKNYDEINGPAREAFERDVIGAEFPRSADPAIARQSFRQRVFGAIGAERLVTSDAREILRTAPSTRIPDRNRRPFEISSEFSESEPHWWLRDAGIDPNSLANAPLLRLADEAHEGLGLNRHADTIGDNLLPAIQQLDRLWRAAQDARAAGVEGKVVAHAESVVGTGCGRIAHKAEQLRAQAEALGELCALIDKLVAHPLPRVEPSEEAADELSLVAVRGPRVDGAEAAMTTCRVDAAAAKHFEAVIRALVRDAHPAVRFASVSHLIGLWQNARALMWELARERVRDESNARVFRFLADFLVRAIHADPAQVEELALLLLPRALAGTDKSAKETVEAIGSIVAVLWVTHAREVSKRVLDEWLEDPASHDPELDHAVHTLRGGLVAGYRTDTPKDAAIRRRCQDFAARVINVTAIGLENYLSLAAEQRNQAADDRAALLAKLLDHTSDQLYFASGAFRGGGNDVEPALDALEAKREFLNDNGATLRRIGDVGTPHTIYQLIELLEFLLPAAPAEVFDLTAHALLTAGRQQGFQFEALGADRFVGVIGRFLADYRSLFADDARRDRLVACLEVFVEAGWPSARRLLYRLPEMLQ